MQENTGPSDSDNSLATTNPGARTSAGHIVIPYVQGLGESIKCTCLKYKDPEEKKSEVIYCHQCLAIDCGEEYIGETSRTLRERYQEYLRGPLPIQEFSQLAVHQTNQDNFSIIGREGQDFTRLIKESIFIRANNSTLNRNIGKFQLSRIWDRVLFRTPGIKVAIQQGNAQHSP